MSHRAELRSFVRGLFLGGALLFVPSFVQGEMFHRVKVEAVSESGRTILIDSGQYFGLETEQLGMFYIFTGDGETALESSDPSFERLGLAEVVQVSPEESYWYFRRPRQDVVIERGQELRMSLKSKDGQGIRPFDVDTKTRVLPKGKLPLHFTEKQSLVKDGENFKGVKNEIETPVPKDEDVQLTHQVHKGPEEMALVSQTTKDQDIKEREQKVRSQKMAEAYESLIQASVDRHNDYPHSLESYYFPDRADPQYRQTQEDLSSVENEFEKYQRKKREQKKVSPTAMKKIERDGELWSADMDSEELREFFVKSGIKSEVRRRELALTERDGHEIQVEYASALGDHTTEADSNLQGKNYSLGVAYEYHLKRLTKGLSRWSTKIGLSQSVSFYDIGGANGVFRSGHLELGVNYYFHRLPTTVDDIIGFAGIGVKRGNGELSSTALTQDYNTQSVLFPVYVGAKYRMKAGDERNQTFHVGWGVFGKLGYQLGSHSPVDALHPDDRGLRTNVSTSEFRFHVGLSSYF